MYVSEKCKRLGRKALTDTRLFYDRTPSSGDTTSEETNLLQRSLLVDGNDRNVSDDSVLREGRCSHLEAESVMHWTWEKGRLRTK